MSNKASAGTGNEKKPIDVKEFLEFMKLCARVDSRGVTRKELWDLQNVPFRVFKNCDCSRCSTIRAAFFEPEWEHLQMFMRDYPEICNPTESIFSPSPEQEEFIQRVFGGLVFLYREKESLEKESPEPEEPKEPEEPTKSSRPGDLFLLIREEGERIENLLKKVISTESDGRWNAIATNHFQQGLMALERAVLKPKHF